MSARNDSQGHGLVSVQMTVNVRVIADPATDREVRQAILAHQDKVAAKAAELLTIAWNRDGQVAFLPDGNRSLDIVDLHSIVAATVVKVTADGDDHLRGVA